MFKYLGLSSLLKKQGLNGFQPKIDYSFQQYYKLEPLFNIFIDFPFG